MTEQNTCFVVVDGYHDNDGYIDGNIRIFSTRQKAEEFIRKYKETMKKSKRPGDCDGTSWQVARKGLFTISRGLRCRVKRCACIAWLKSDSVEKN